MTHTSIALLIGPSENLKDQLKSLGVDSVEALYGMMKAIPEEFQKGFNLSLQEFQNLSEEIEKILPEETLTILNKPPSNFALGAILPNNSTL